MNGNRIRALATCGLFVLGAGQALAAEPTLTEQLQARAEASKSQMPAESQTVMDKALQSLRDSGIAEQVLKKGGVMPDFTLPGVDGKAVSSKALRMQGPLVVTFYRGGWCPYCSLQLHDLQKHLGEIRAAGASLVAISPQTPDGSLSTAQKQALKFHVLSDSGNRVAKSFGLAYRLPPDLVETYRGFGLDLARINGTDEWELPLGATYVVTRQGKVVYAFVDTDYKKRAETLDIVRVLKELDGR